MTPRGRKPLRADGAEPAVIYLRLDEAGERALARISRHLGNSERPVATQAREAILLAGELLSTKAGGKPRGKTRPPAAVKPARKKG